MIAYSFYEQDNRVMRYAETLAARGDSVDVICLMYGDGPVREVINGVNVTRVQKREKNESSRWTYLIRLLLFLAQALRVVTWRHMRERYDLIHVHSVPDFLIFAAIVPRISGCPIILDLHDLLPEFYASKFGDSSKSFWFKLLVLEERLSATLAQHVIIPNPLWEERVVKRSVPAEKCSVIINAPDFGIFKREPNGHRDKSRFVILYPGSLNWHQGLDIAIKAVGLLRDRFPHINLEIYGSGPELANLRHLVQELRLEDQVNIMRPKPIREIAQIMSLADLGIVPKRSDSFGNEAFSTKILEFMAVGVPVLVSDTKIDRLFFDESVVQFFPSGNVEELARELAGLIEDKQRRTLMASRAFHFAEANNWSANRHIYLGLVDATINSPAEQVPYKASL